MKQSKKDVFFEIIRFLIVGGVATLVDYIVFYLFNLVILKRMNNGVNVAISTTLGFAAGLFVNWILSKFVYKQVTDSQMHSKAVFTKYVILALFGFFLTLIVMTITSPIHDKLVLGEKI